MNFDVMDLTDRVRELLDHYTVGDEEGELLVDLDAWSSEDLKEMIGLLTSILRMRDDEDSLNTVMQYYEETFEDWLEQQIDAELALSEDDLMELTDEYREWEDNNRL